jgi:nitrite reductase (NO-forming)
MSRESHSHKSSRSLLIEAMNHGLMALLAGGIAYWGIILFAGGITQFIARRAAPVTGPAEAAPAAPLPSGSPPPAGPVAAQAAPASAAVGGDLHAVGQQVYSTVCIACHQPTGMGLPNMFPPLGGSDWVNAEKPDRLIRIVLHGLMGPIKVNGMPFTSAAPLMPPQGAMLSDQQIAGALSYVRGSFGNKAGPVTPEQVRPPHTPSPHHVQAQLDSAPSKAIS